MTKSKGTRYMGNDEHGNPIIEQYDVDEVPPTKLTPSDYDRRVAELIAERYSINDQLAFSLNRMCVFDANMLPRPKCEEYNAEYYAYQQFREQCKIQARKDCGIE